METMLLLMRTIVTDAMTMVTVTQMLLSAACPVLVRTERITWAQTQCGTQ